MPGSITIRKEGEAEGGFQRVLHLPVREDERKRGKLLCGASSTAFLAFEGQGEILLKSSDPASFEAFVNGAEIPLSEMEAERWYAADLSSVSVNGDNHLLAACLSDREVWLEIRIPYPEIVDCSGDYEENDALNLLDRFIQEETLAGYPSAQYVLLRNGKLIRRRAFGLLRSYDTDLTRRFSGEKVTDDTLFDLASNTKMFAVNFALKKLSSEGKLDLEKRVREYLPEFRDREEDEIRGKDQLTVREILEHQAGFPACPRYYDPDYDPKSQRVVPGSSANDLYSQKREEALSKIIATPLLYEPGTKTLYSDVDYMLLGFLVEKITGRRLDDYCREAFYEPLGLRHTCFNPLEHGYQKADCAATEIHGNTRQGQISFENIRTDTLQGQVHDENAFYTMQGISGHAGLFSNAGDLAVLAQILVNRGGYGRHRFFDADTLDQFLKPKNADPSFGLGWRRKAEDGYTEMFSSLCDSQTVGHSGWTGTLTLIDPIQHVVFILLTSSRNTPLLNPEADVNDFAGCHFLISRYGVASTLVFASERSSRCENSAYLADLIRAKLSLIQTDPGSDSSYDRADLFALLSAARERQSDAAILGLKKSGVWDRAVKETAFCGSRNGFREEK